MNDLKKAVSKTPIDGYELAFNADVSIDGVALPWDAIVWANEHMSTVCLKGDAGRFIQTGRNTAIVFNSDGAYLFGNVVITNVVDKLDDETVKVCENAFSAMSSSGTTIAEATGEPIKCEWSYMHHLISQSISDERISNPKYNGYFYGSGIQNKGVSLWRKIMNSLRLRARGDL